MPWGKLDDSLYDNPKLDKLGKHRMAGVGLWAVAISWCNRWLTDGLVTPERVRALGGTIRQAEALVVAGLFDRAEGGYAVHDFLAFNDSRADVLARRESQAQRQRKSRGQSQRESHGESQRDYSRSHSTPPRAFPARPVPALPDPATPPDPPEVSIGDPVVVYANLAGGWPSPKAMDWLDDLTGQWGAEAVIRALAKAGGPPNKVIGAAQDLLRAEARELSLKEKTVERERVTARRLDGMHSRRVEYFRNTGQWDDAWGERPAA